MSITWGVSAGGHDAALAVIADGEITWAAHSERFSRVKNDPLLDETLLSSALLMGLPDRVVWHEKTLLRRTREIYAGQYSDAFGYGPRRHLLGMIPRGVPLVSVSHHHSHAAGGYYTSGFDRAAVLVVDAIGEWDSTTLWLGRGDDLRCIARALYPNSIGLFYTAMTQRCGFKPNEEEYIMMGLAAYGDPFKYRDLILGELIEMTNEWPYYQCKVNMHRGINWWHPEISDASDLAAAAQQIFTEIMLRLAGHAKSVAGGNLVLSGGCALNCVTNAEITRALDWDSVWIMPNPGDAGNSLGAALAWHGRHVRWETPYLGTLIPGKYPVESVLSVLKSGGIAGVANGKAEFGPRALGNRSLLGDPRDPDMKAKMNRAKKREQFRPFAPVIREEDAKRYFHLDGITPHQASYMQFVARCRYPEEFPGICHVDGTSRIQTVTRQQHPGLHELLSRWGDVSGCPMLVNTSLNIKGQPLVDNAYDATRFTAEYGIPVFTHA